MPVLRSGASSSATTSPARGARLRDELGKLVEDLEETCVKFEDAKARRLEREAKMADKKNAVLAGAST